MKSDAGVTVLPGERLELEALPSEQLELEALPSEQLEREIHRSAPRPARPTRRR
jgi:hypothetical protein